MRLHQMSNSNYEKQLYVEMTKPYHYYCLNSVHWIFPLMQFIRAAMGKKSLLLLRTR